MKSKILIVAITLLLCGCAEKVRIRFTQKDIATIHFDMDKCVQESSGDLRCKDVLVRLNRIEAKP